MLPTGLRRPRFSLKSVFILMLGIAIGFALNLQTWRLLTGPSNESQMVSLPTYVIEPPDILQIDLLGESPNASTAVTGQHFVAMDGRVNLGAFGSVYVAGMTLEEARTAIERKLSEKLDAPEIVVDVLAYNSKVYYVVNRNPSGVDDVARLPITGNETALDAVAQIGGVKATDSTEMWIARPSSTGVGSEQILPIDWDDIARGVSTTTNYQLLPGDRVFITQQPKASATQ